jgi:hypothetical protein
MSANNRLIPAYLFESYSNIIKCNLIANKNINNESVAEFQDLLNASIPKTESDINYKEVIKYLYRKNPINFYKLIITSRLNNIVLWTESKCIVSHFGLKNIVYIKWDKVESMYKCNIHNNITSDLSKFTNTLRQGIGSSTFLQNTRYNEVGMNSYNNTSRLPNHKYNRVYYKNHGYKDFIPETDPGTDPDPDPAPGPLTKSETKKNVEYKQEYNKSDVITKNKYSNLETSEKDDLESVEETDI